MDRFQIPRPKFQDSNSKGSVPWGLDLETWDLGLLKNVQIYPVQSIIFRIVVIYPTMPNFES